MTPIVVQKYGGSSVATPEKLKRVAELVVARKRTGARLVVVVSAMGDTTDELLTLAKRVVDAPPRRELDMLVSSGERISMALLSMAIQALGEQAISFTGSQSGIITDTTHFSARIIEIRPDRIRAALDDGKIVIVAGYQGMSTEREITTLGRGGSDTSAVALAAALAAEACEIYSDVDGVFSADPRVVTDAQRIPALTYDEMEAFAGAGAKVLNAEAVAFARRAGITIHARKTGAASQGSVVMRSVPVARGVSGVALKEAVVYVECGAAELWALVDRARIEGLSVHGGTAHAWLDFENSGAEAAVRSELGARGRSADVVSIVGEHAATLKGAVERAARLADPIAIVVEPNRIALVVAAGRGRDVTRALHGAFVGAGVS